MSMYEIERDGKRYFLDWDKYSGLISITECLPEDYDDDYFLETYDFKELTWVEQ